MARPATPPRGAALGDPSGFPPSSTWRIASRRSAGLKVWLYSVRARLPDQPYLSTACAPGMQGCVWCAFPPLALLAPASS